jgi:catalase-peroxidase
MLTTDLSLKIDPIYGPIARRFYDNPDEFADAFAKAWYKLTHRDMGPVSRYLGSLVPTAPQLWQDPVPPVDHELVGEEDVAALKTEILGSELSLAELIGTAWSSAATFRGTDERGGANGARIRLAPQKDWEVNAGSATVLETLERIRQEFNVSQPGNKRISLADLIVLGGCAAVEQAARDAGHDVTVPFAPGRTDASQEQTDVDSFAVLEPRHDGFINYLQPGQGVPAEHLLVERANLLTLTAPELTVLVGGLRALGANLGQSEHGVFTDRPGTLTNDFFVNLLDMDTEWKSSDSAEGVYEGSDRNTGEAKWTGTAVDLVFGSNSQLRAIAEVYATDDANDKFAHDFVAAWDKVMSLDRFDLD